MQFPFSVVRGPQQEMINDVKEAVEKGRHLVANAPTGLGKTIAALYPALEYAQKEKKTVLFLTSRLSQHKMAIETLQSLGSIGAVDIIGKKWLCSHDVADNDSGTFGSYCYAMVRDDMCRFYKNFKHKGIVSQGALSMIRALRERPLHSEEAKEMAGGNYCTYELLMEAARGSNAIVCDYFHIFSANGKKFFKRLTRDPGDCIIVVDEAHNLPDRIRNNLSFKISTRTIDLAAKESKNFGLGMTKEIKYVENALLGSARRKLMGVNEAFLTKEDITAGILDYDNLIAKLAKSGEKVIEEKKKSHILKMAIFLEEWKNESIGFTRIVSRDRSMGNDYISVHHNCMDPSIISKPIMNEAHSVILMSGTLHPGEMYRDLLGMEEKRTTLKSYPSPFDKNNRLNLINTNITTAYKKRTTESFIEMAKSVAISATAVRGNVAVFFPSYDIMRKIHILSSGQIRKKIFMEEQGMSKQDKKHFQEEFATHGNAVLFGVLGGSFSEGIDLPGEKLNGVIIVGLPLERPNLSVKSLIDYYQTRFGKGNEYGYFYPAMIKVMQAAGRCIRSETDTGVCIFADERYMWANYRRIFPSDWKFTISQKPEIEISKFFENRKAVVKS